MQWLYASHTYVTCRQEQKGCDNSFTKLWVQLGLTTMGTEDEELTVNACMPTWGTLWFTRFMIDLRQSFALWQNQRENDKEGQGNIYIRERQTFIHSKITIKYIFNKKVIIQATLKLLIVTKISIKHIFIKILFVCFYFHSPIGSCPDPVTDFHNEGPVLWCASFTRCFLWISIQTNKFKWNSQSNCLLLKSHIIT